MIDAKVHTLLTLVEAGSYTKAAELLHLTQPAVSHHIRLLEKLYGIKIFHPGKKELRLTPEGSILLKYAHRLTAIDHRARQAIEDSRRELTHITIGLTQTGGENKMPQVLALYCREHPGLFSFSVRHPHLFSQHPQGSAPHSCSCRGSFLLP